MRVGQQQAPASEAAFGSALLAGALALGSLLLARGGFKFGRSTGQTGLRGVRRAAAVGLAGSRRSMRADLADLAEVPRPTDPAHDLKTSLGELMADLQRARVASYSPRSFAPRPRQVNKHAAVKKRQAPTTANAACQP
jgi:hypothetical protein